MGIAQDQNHSLTLINNYINGCIRRLEVGNYESNELLKILKKVADQSQALDKIIQRRKILTSKTIFRYESTDIHTVISQSILLLVGEMYDFPINIQYAKTHNLANVKLDIFHIQQAILNLARNAMESMRDGNILEPKLLIETAQKNANMIEITLFDNGPGLTEEVIPKLFEPHFTTKSYGVGLGLTVSRAIIEKHGGQLSAAPNPSGGACFSFTLPCVSPKNLSIDS
jgi:two-component system sensor kinase FixL